MREKQWHIDIYIDEEDGRTRAEARMENPDKVNLVGLGHARCNPTDSNIPEIGDELAVARALADLAHQLIDATAGDIEAITNRPAHLAG